MAVQAQYPSNVLNSDFRKRARTEICNGVDEFSFQENLLQLYSAGLNALPQPGLNASNAEVIELAHNLTPARKKFREDDALVIARQQASFAPLLVDLERNNFVVPLKILQQSTTVPCLNGLRLPSTDTTLLAPITTFTSGRANVGPSLSSILSSDEFQLQDFKHTEEIDQIIKLHGERMQQALVEIRQRHTRAVLALVEQCVLLRIREKEVEIEEVSRRNVELVDHVKRLSLESQIWQNVARSNEAMVTSLRNNLEQVIAQIGEQCREGRGETNAEDAESCIHGESGGVGGALHARTAKEMRDLSQQMNCRICRNSDVCILLLPCRHLCVCKECDARLTNCPICGASKNASVQIYTD